MDPDQTHMLKAVQPGDFHGSNTYLRRHLHTQMMEVGGH